MNPYGSDIDDNLSLHPSEEEADMLFEGTGGSEDEVPDENYKCSSSINESRKRKIGKQVNINAATIAKGRKSQTVSNKQVKTNDRLEKIENQIGGLSSSIQKLIEAQVAKPLLPEPEFENQRCSFL